ncbi:MAG: polysaccharide biosynthesis/export family protein [Saprospiraceae bacterium]|nr:polysaccharide biosynthesis/export family protein [Saprospiraceae bacterium]
MLGLTACVSHQELVNFNEGAAFPASPELITNIPELRIQKKDILAISVQTTLGLNPEDVAPFNLQGGNIPGNSLNYQVDGNGNIEFPMVGQVHLEGLTLYEAKDTLTELLTRDFKAPVVNIRFTSFKFTILGEVSGPGTYTLPDDRVSILDALAFGDMTSYADRYNIMIVREQNGQREYGNINIHDRQLFQSPYFYLRPNDFIYVHPLKEKVGTVSDQFTKVLPWIGLGTTLLNLIIILTRT